MSLSPEDVLLRVAEDTGPFIKLGGTFKSAGSPWIGPVIASANAIYMIKKSKASSQSYGGGLVGVLLSQALAKDDGISTCSAGDLPAAVRAFIDPKGKLKAKDVVIVPKATVSFVKAGGWNNAITFSAGLDQFIANTGLFGMFRRPRELAQLGWILNQAIIPEAEAVHDTRPPELKGADRSPPLWKKVGLIALAVVILIAVIALRIAAH